MKPTFAGALMGLLMIAAIGFSIFILITVLWMKIKEFVESIRERPNIFAGIAIFLIVLVAAAYYLSH